MLAGLEALDRVPMPRATEDFVALAIVWEERVGGIDHEVVQIPEKASVVEKIYRVFSDTVTDAIQNIASAGVERIVVRDKIRVAVAGHPKYTSNRVGPITVPLQDLLPNCFGCRGQGGVEFSHPHFIRNYF